MVSVAVDRALVANLLMINGASEFEAFRSWLQEKRDFWRDTTEAQQDTALYRAQGRAQMLKEILELLAQAPSLADKYRG